jgi:hypothetical protein
LATVHSTGPRRPPSTQQTGPNRPVCLWRFLFLSLRGAWSYNETLLKHIPFRFNGMVTLQNPLLIVKVTFVSGATEVIMGVCVNHSHRETSYRCSKYDIYLCEECLQCRDPDIYCKFRSACPISFISKDNGRLNGPDAKKCMHDRPAKAVPSQGRDG